MPLKHRRYIAHSLCLLPAVRRSVLNRREASADTLQQDAGYQ